MKAFILLPLATLGLAACAMNSPGVSPVAATAPMPAASAPVANSFSANPPDRPTGSQQYQSPDTDRHPDGHY